MRGSVSPAPSLLMEAVSKERALFTLSEACCSMLRIQLRMLVNDASSVTSYTSRMPIAPR